jgi:hypothetical protein
MAIPILGTVLVAGFIQAAGRIVVAPAVCPAGARPAVVSSLRILPVRHESRTRVPRRRAVLPDLQVLPRGSCHAALLPIAFGQATAAMPRRAAVSRAPPSIGR